jgi:TPR repeat protein
LPAKKTPVKKTPVVARRSATKPHPHTALSIRAVHGVLPATSTSALGADEMKRAANASDAEARAAWLWKAVSKGNPQASVELARMYKQGSGVIRSCAQAEVLLHSAAAKGNAQAKLDLQQIRMRGGCSAR